MEHFMCQARSEFHTQVLSLEVILHATSRQTGYVKASRTSLEALLGLGDADLLSSPLGVPFVGRVRICRGSPCRGSGQWVTPWLLEARLKSQAPYPRS